MLDKQTSADIFAKAGIGLDDEKYERLALYSKMLVERNKSVNLTAITDDEGVTVKHFFDSIYPFTLCPPKQGASLIDVGTGAGFPSCPLKIFRDDIQLTLLDSLNKRINFLTELSDSLKLNARCIHGRAEEFGRKEGFRDSFDIATARAVGNLSLLCEYCLPFVKVGGAFIALKGSNGEEELNEAKNAVKLLNAEVEKVEHYDLPNGDGRTLIVLKKVAPTPKKFPRNAGQIKKQPL